MKKPPILIGVPYTLFLTVDYPGTEPTCHTEDGTPHNPAEEVLKEWPASGMTY